MLNTLVSTITYNGNDATTTFDYPFKIWAASEIELWITDAAGAETEVTTNFTLAGVGDETGGTVTYPTSGDPLPTGHKLTLRRVLEISQGFFDAVNNQAFHAETLESAIDKTVAQIQQVKADVDLGLRGSLASGIDPELPLPQAGKVLAWNATEDGIVNLAASGVVAEGSIGTTELGDDAVTGVKIAAAVAGDGLGRDVSDNFEVNVDDSTIEIATDILQVKDAGVTLAKLNADVVGRLIDVQVFTTDGTWTKPSGCTNVEAWVIGGGGGGGFAATAGRNASGGGGGGGTYEHITAGLGATETITIGAAGIGGIGVSSVQATAGGNSSFGSHSTANGGTAGISNSQAAAGVIGGTASGGDINITGGWSGPGIDDGTQGHGGYGGSPSFEHGHGGAGGNARSSDVAGEDATGYGGGGGGAVSIPSAAQVDGGAGTPGIIIVKSYS